MGWGPLYTIITTGGVILGKALVDATKQTMFRKKQFGPKGGISLAEAQKILGINPPFSAREISEKYEKLFKANDPRGGGSFYLQSKVYRAKERLDMELNQASRAPKRPGTSESAGSSAGGEASTSSS